MEEQAQSRILVGSLGKEAVVLGNLMGKAIEWSGEQWTE